MGRNKPEYRFFKATCFDNVMWSSWLHWENSKEKAYCIICHNIYALKQLTSSQNKGFVFTTTGYASWKDTNRSFQQQHRRACHRESVMKWEHHLKGADVSVQLQKQLGSEQEAASHCLKILYFYRVSCSARIGNAWALRRG